MTAAERGEHEGVVPPLAARGKLAVTEDELIAWGERLGRSVRPPLLITITGELGAGKTTLARAICHGYGVSEEVTSPTFALVHEYEGALSKVYHLDLYRLSRPDELVQLGWDDMLRDQTLMLVEWPDRAADAMPLDRLLIDLEHVPNDSSRRLLYAGGHVGETQFGDHS